MSDVAEQRKFELIDMCDQCGNDTHLTFPSALPDAPDFGEYQCPSCGHAQKGHGHE